MAHEFITLTPQNIDSEHICCAFSDKKCREGYELKKAWLKREFENGYVFRRLDERAKVFIEYGPAERGWVPVDAPDYLLVNCFWVSGQYQKKGYAKALLQSALDDAAARGMNGLVTAAGTKKFHFMSDTKWLLRQGFVEADTTPDGFSLLVRKLDAGAPDPKFRDCVRLGEVPDKKGVVVYYTNRCPFTEYHVRVSLAEAAAKRGIPLKVIELKTPEEARNAPSPATVFSLFYNGKFVTTDVSACMDSRFDKLVER